MSPSFTSGSLALAALVSPLQPQSLTTGDLPGGPSLLTHSLDSVEHQHGLTQNQEENSCQDSAVLVRLARRMPLGRLSCRQLVTSSLLVRCEEELPYGSGSRNMWPWVLAVFSFPEAFQK